MKYTRQRRVAIQVYNHKCNIDISRNTCATTWQIATGKKKQIAGHYWLRTGQSQFVWNKSILEKRREEPSLFVINKGMSTNCFYGWGDFHGHCFRFVANKLFITFKVSLGNNSEVLFILQHIFNLCHFPFHKDLCSLCLSQKTQKNTQKHEIHKCNAVILS